MITLLGALGVLSVGLLPASPALAAAPAPATATATAETPSSAAAPAPQVAAASDGQIEVRGDVLGLGYDQIIRLAGPQLQIVEPRGGAILRAFDVDDAASQLAVRGTAIYVGSVYNVQNDGAVGSRVRVYTAEGALVNERAFPAGIPITSLNPYTHEGRDYLEVGLGTYGTRTLAADVPGMPDAPR